MHNPPSQRGWYIQLHFSLHVAADQEAAVHRSRPVVHVQTSVHYAADLLTVHRSRPVVHVVQASVQYQTGQAGLVDLADPAHHCLLDDGRQVSCVSVLVCLSYDGVQVDRRAGETPEMGSNWIFTLFFTFRAYLLSHCT